MPRVETGMPRVEIGMRRVETGMPRVETGMPRVETGMPRVETGIQPPSHVGLRFMIDETASLDMARYSGRPSRPA